LGASAWSSPPLLTDFGEFEVFREELLIRTLLELTDNLVDDFDVMDLLTTLSDRCVSILDVDAAGVMLADQAGQLQVVASSSDAMRTLELFELQTSEGPCVDCYNTGAPIINRELSVADGRWPSFTPRALEGGFHSVHSLPLHLGRKTVGALNMFRIETGLLGPAEVLAAQALADIATLAIVQNHAAADTRDLNTHLTEVLDTRLTIEQAKGKIAGASDIASDQAFEQLRRHAQNHNVGLGALARAIAEGVVDPRSLDARWTPQIADVGSGHAGTAGESSMPSKTVSVCLIDDHDRLRDQIRDFLTDSGIKVIASVGSIREGELAVRTHLPDVAIIDYRLTDGTGIELIRTLTRTSPNVTLLLYTASATDAEMREAVHAGATAAIRKTIQGTELLTAILNSADTATPEGP
jgi:CheY-like chemotaxis protein